MRAQPHLRGSGPWQGCQPLSRAMQACRLLHSALSFPSSLTLTTHPILTLAPFQASHEAFASVYAAAGALPYSARRAPNFLKTPVAVASSLSPPSSSACACPSKCVTHCSLRQMTAACMVLTTHV